VRLIEISSFVNGVGDRDALLQESGRPLGAFDLMDVALGQAGSSQETMPHRAGRHLLRVTL
jgi:hypothetical protein